MSYTLKLTTIGNAVGIILPKEMLEKLHVGPGDALYAVETAQGIELSPYQPEVAAQMDIAEQIMREHQGVLRRLAK